MRLTLLIFLLVALKAPAQNLLVNGSFEEENICIEYQVNCAPEAWIYTVPSFIYYFKDRTLAYDGEHFVGLIAGHAIKQYYRTFVRSQLLCQLKKGKTYRFQCFVKSAHPILDSVGVYFSQYDFLFEKQPYRKVRPSLYFADAQLKPVKGDTGWQKVSVDYVATGEEVFITLGNFSQGDITGHTNIPLENNFFVLFDNVSLAMTDPNEILCRDWQKARDDIYAQDERHEYQARKMRSYKTSMPAVTPLSSTIVLKVDTLLVPDVLFSTNSFVINKNTQYVLDSFSKRVGDGIIDSIVIAGHTDSRGTEHANLELSWRRAASVAAYLEEHVKAPFITRGYGSSRPIADNRTEEGRQRNRRVEILLYKYED